MKRFLPLLVLLCGLGFVVSKLLPPRSESAFDFAGFGRLPILANGRIKPLDTIARSTLLQIQSRQRVSTPEVSEPLVSSPTEWLLDVAFRPEKADAYPTFTIDNPELLSLLGKNEDAIKINYDDPTKRVLAIVGFLPSHRRRFSFDDIRPFFSKLDEQTKLAGPIEASQRTSFQRALVQLYENLVQYQRLRTAFTMPGRPDFLGDLIRLQDQLPTGAPALFAKRDNKPHDAAAAAAMMEYGEQFLTMRDSTNLLVIPPDKGNGNDWQTSGAALLESFQSLRVNPNALAYAGLAHAWRAQQPDKFNELLGLFRTELGRRYEAQLAKAAAEARFNAAEPFYTSMTLYACAFFFGIGAWLAWPDTFGKAAFLLVGLAFVVATAGIIARMWLEGRPPVTNLYSSALFVGWVAVAFCLVLEYFYRNAVGSVVAGAIGFGTLLIAHHLSLSGDTLEMMRAVLDSNFWLATHVVTVTAGYGATGLAGCLAIAYIFLGVFTRVLPKNFDRRAAALVATGAVLTMGAVGVVAAGAMGRPNPKKPETTAATLERMVYGIICFATLFSFVGTILGGIWADQSWGRFWGWDPKENGALIIVLWNAIILHARAGGMIKARGLMCLAVGGNIVVGWSWFGVNMLGVGLHNYGFTESAFFWLSTFAATQVIIIALANLPLSKWRSFRGSPPANPPAASAKTPEAVSV